MDVLGTIKKYKVVPVAVFNDIESALPSVEALKKGGLPIVEITFRTECAAEAIKLARKTFPDVLVGAGTVINAKQCREAIDCGAMFIVGPGFSEEVAEVCKEAGIMYVPGVITPTEIICALKYDLSILKFFPASDFGGLKTIKALAAAFPKVNFLPTGGINEQNILEYLSYPKIIACGGSFMMKGTPQEIENNTANLMKLIGGSL